MIILLIIDKSSVNRRNRDADKTIKVKNNGFLNGNKTVY